MTDPMDDFEFKPLTEGLGFHQKSADAEPKSTRLSENTGASRTERRPSATMSTSASARSLSLSDETEDDLLGREKPRATSKSISDLIAALPPSLDFVSEKNEAASVLSTSTMPDFATVPEPETTGARPQIFQPLAREDYQPKTAPAASSNSMLPPPGTKAAASIASSAAIPAPTTSPSPYRARIEDSLARAFPNRKKNSEAARKPMVQEFLTVTPIAGHFGSGILDGMVVTGMTTLLLVTILLITHVNLVGLLSNAQTDGPTQFHLFLLFLAVLQLYMLTARSFFGASLGEWAFDLQLGAGSDQKKPVYPLQVAWRTLLISLTGLALLPALSLVFRRDLLRFVTGLQLYRKT